MRENVFTITKLVLYFFAYQLGFSAVATGFAFFRPTDTTALTALVMVASNLAMMGHIVHFDYIDIARDRYREIRPSVLGVSVIFIFTAMYVLNLLIEQADIPNTQEDTFLALSRNPFGILSMTLLGPILEELLFRGAIQGRLQRSGIRPWTAILIASFLFGLVHMNPAQILFAIPLGIMFGWLYYRTGSLLPGIVGHVLNNTVASVNMILYGNTPLEEQITNSIAMWICAATATLACSLAAMWLNKKI